MSMRSYLESTVCRFNSVFVTFGQKISQIIKTERCEGVFENWIFFGNWPPIQHNAQHFSSSNIDNFIFKRQPLWWGTYRVPEGSVLMNFTLMLCLPLVFFGLVLTISSFSSVSSLLVVSSLPSSLLVSLTRGVLASISCACGRFFVFSLLLVCCGFFLTPLWYASCSEKGEI